MSYVEIKPSSLSGSIKIPPSKSLSHRAIICAALSEGISEIDNIIFSKDIIATIQGMKSLGIDIKELEGKVRVKGRKELRIVNEIIDCNESGSTLRFLIPLALVPGEKVTFIGKGKLVERPLEVFYDIFKKEGIKYENNEGKLPLTISGKLKAGTFEVRGDISSQFITGLLFALPLLEGDSKIIISTELESKGYIDLTLQVLETFGVHIENKAYKEFYIKGSQEYKAQDYRVEGDFSQAAFWLVAGVVGGNICCKDLNINSLQGDKVILDIIKAMGVDIEAKAGAIRVNKSVTEGIVIDGSQCPDLVPILAVLGALSKGTTKIINAERVRIKESDRLKAISTELKILGADITELKDGLVIKGKDMLEGGTVHSWNDHRIAMALAVAATRCTKPVIIKDSEAVSKSYPEFWRDFQKLGGQCEVL